MRSRSVLAVLFISIFMLACGGEDPVTDGWRAGYTWKPEALTSGGTYSKVVFTAQEATTVLDMVNAATLTQLDDEIALHATAAKNIVAARAIKTMTALDKVSYVGATALKALKAYVPKWTNTPAPGSSVSQSGVTFTSAEVTTVLEMANDATQTQLDKDISLHSTAAKNIVAARPINTMAELDSVSYVGATALKALRAYVSKWTAAGGTTTGGTHDLVTFTAAEEKTALEIANKATDLQLKTGGVTTSPRKKILAGRTWASLSALAATSGIGPSTMKALRSMASSWTGAVTPPTKLTIKTLAAEAATNGTSSSYYGKVVSVARAIVTTYPSKTSAGNLSFYVADPSTGYKKQLKVYISAKASLTTAFISQFDDLSITGKFTRYGSTWELLLDSSKDHAVALNKSGLGYKYYYSVQAAWKSTSKNPEGVVRVTSSTGYVFMVPLPVFQDHPMWNGTRPAAPKDSGNVQDLSWNAAAQKALNTWLASSG